MNFYMTDDPIEIAQAKELLYYELFKPLNMPVEIQEQLRVEGREYYFIASHDDKVLSVMVLVVNGLEFELHHAATLSSYRSKGIGCELWKVVLAFADKNCIKEIFLYSRNTALRFWSLMGFIEESDKWLESDLFLKHNIRHKKMKIKIK